MAEPALTFDGLDLVALEVPDVAPLLGLYRDGLGFEVAGDDDGADTGALGALLGLDRPVRRATHLVRGAGTGGSLLLVETGCEPGGRAGAPRRRGPYALDFYLRDAETTEVRLADAGWGFTSPAVHYDLPGTSIPVREHMLEQTASGLLHAMVQHRPRGTRSVLGESEAGVSSEVVAVVVLTDDLPAARTMARDALGGQEYFAGLFAGDAVETMLDLPAGHGLDAALFRGPRSRNARLEFARPVDDAGRPVPLAPRPPGPRTVVALYADDVDATSAAVGRHPAAGSVSPVHGVVVGGRPHRGVRIDTPHDLALCLLQPADR